MLGLISGQEYNFCLKNSCIKKIKKIKKLRSGFHPFHPEKF